MVVAQMFTILVGILLIYGLDRLLSTRVDGDDAILDSLKQAKSIKDHADKNSMRVLGLSDPSQPDGDSNS